ncbi:MAG: hypothetical protein AB8B97_06525 [Granulosicoccus sp.]
MHYRWVTTILLLCTVLATGCSSLKTPVRPDYPGADSVSTADAAQLVGVWSVSDLNPYPGNEPQTTTIEYRDDGTVTGLVVPKGDGMEALGNLEFELTGNWVLDGDVLSHENMTMKSTNGNAMGGLLSKIVNSRPAVSGQANIYELSDTRIVMVGSDGAAMEYVRQQ